MQPTDHKWITAKTYVSFGDAQKFGVQEEVNLAKQIAIGTIKKHLPMNQAVLSKIVAAGKQSKAIPEDFKGYL